MPRTGPEFASLISFLLDILLYSDGAKNPQNSKHLCLRTIFEQVDRSCLNALLHKIKAKFGLIYHVEEEWSKSYG